MITTKKKPTKKLVEELLRIIQNENLFHKSFFHSNRKDIQKFNFAHCKKHLKVSYNEIVSYSPFGLICENLGIIKNNPSLKYFDRSQDKKDTYLVYGENIYKLYRLMDFKQEIYISGLADRENDDLLEYLIFVQKLYNLGSYKKSLIIY